MGTFYVKLLWIPFGQPLEKIGLLFPPTSSHTVQHPRQKFKFQKCRQTGGRKAQEEARK